jgi:transcriptional regulator with XRE-family HTH domain
MSHQDTINNYGQALVDYRAKYHMTQKQLAKYMCVSRGTINRIENGRYPFVSRVMQAKIELLIKGERR